MLAVFGAIDPSPRPINVTKKRFLTGTLLGFRSLNPSFFNAPRIPKPWTDLETTIKIIGVIEKAIVIIAFAAQDFQALSQLLG